MDLKKLKSKLRGYNKLKQSNNLHLWRDLKLSFQKCNPIGNCQLSKLFFGRLHEQTAVAIHQYCVEKIAKNWLGGNLLIKIDSPSWGMVYPLPKAWQHILINNSFSVSEFKSDVLFICLITRNILLSILSAIRIIFFSSKNNYLKSRSKSFHFLNLTKNNISQSNDHKTENIINWFLESSLYGSSCKTIYHDVPSAENLSCGDVNIEYKRRPCNCLDSLSKKINFFVWISYIFPLAILRLFKGEWWYALMLNECILAKVIELNGATALDLEYFVPYSGNIYKPLWAHMLEKMGSKVTAFFYSSYEQPQITTVNNSMAFEFYLYNWTNTLVWDEIQAELIKESSSFNPKIEIVGPINFSDTDEPLPRVNENSIAVFDVEMHRKAFYFSSSSLAEYYEENPGLNGFFLQDIYKTAAVYKFSIYHKTKRNISKRRTTAYRNLLNRLQGSPFYFNVMPEIAASRLIKSCRLVISQPFTSTALIAKNLAKPNIYYDPTGWIQKNDPAAHGVPIISGKEELRVWFETLMQNK